MSVRDVKKKVPIIVSVHFYTPCTITYPVLTPRQGAMQQVIDFLANAM